MQHIEASGAVQPLYKSLGVKGLTLPTHAIHIWQHDKESICYLSMQESQVQRSNINATCNDQFFIMIQIKSTEQFPSKPCIWL